ncbi:MAG: hypothetical protein GVY35_04735 [Bacteroidetes bacterium]|jgi:uncharacterized membrane protein|nr:hypothetical protein [Bacteroidota bacterium]
MTLQTKSALLLGGALVTGVLLGALIVGAFVSQRVDRLDALREPTRLTRFMEDAIEPTSPAQRDSIRTVLRYRARQTAAILQDTRRDLRAVQDSLRADLQPLLSDEQLSRLRERMRMGPPGPRPRFLPGGPFIGPDRRPPLRDGPGRWRDSSDRPFSPIRGLRPLPPDSM